MRAMLKQSFILGVVVLALGVCDVQAALIAQWNFDEAPGTTVAHDSIGGHDGQLSGDANFVGGGISGNTLQISRSGNGFVNVGDYFDFTNGDFSIVAWIKLPPETALPDSVFIGKHRSGTDAGYFLAVNYSWSGQTDTPTFWQHSYYYVNAMTDVNDGNWHQVVGVYQQGGTASIYVDGTFQNSIQSAPIAQIDVPFLVGGISYGDTPTGMFDGFVDKLRLYDNALTSEEIQILFITDPSAPSGCIAPSWCEGADINKDGRVDFEDFAILANHWLEGVNP